MSTLVAFPHQPEPITTPIADELALSPSEASCFMDCPAKWRFKYRDRLPDPKTAALALGIAVHEAISENFRQKKETREDLPVEAAQTIFREAWGEQLDTADLRYEEDPLALRETGDSLTRVYITERAPLIDPRDVELEVAGHLGGVKVHGKVDVISTAGRIHDVKNRAKAPYQISSTDRFQAATYVELAPNVTGEVVIETLTKTKTVKAHEQLFSIDRKDRQSLNVLYPLALDGMRTGVYLPNRGSMLCSRKNCAFWAACEDIYGGHVEES